MNTLDFISNSEEDTRKFAARFAESLNGHEKICLTGPFGAGKTTFVRGFVQAFGVSPSDVYSPTFTLVREYGRDKKIYHVDLYRLENEEDIFEAGIYELLASEDLVLIEWADRLKRYYPRDAIGIDFQHVSENQRSIEVNRGRAEAG